MEHTEFTPNFIFQPNVTEVNATILSKLANNPPPWRHFDEKRTEQPKEPKPEPEPRPISNINKQRGENYLVDEHQARVITAALALRRPVLVSGRAGVGKTSLAYAIAWQLGLGNVLRWSINSRSTLREGLYEYDAVARLHDASLKTRKDDTSPLPPSSDEENIGDYITLGPLGTALLSRNRPNGLYQPRVLLIDELDKSDIDLPNDLLHVLEEGRFNIPEVARRKSKAEAKVRLWKDDGFDLVPLNGEIRCDDFPLVIITTNGEREFSPAFRRRCLEMEVKYPDKESLAKILTMQMKLTEPVSINEEEGDYTSSDLILNDLLKKLQSNDMNIKDAAVDQLLNAYYFMHKGFKLDDDILESVFRPINKQ